MSNTYKAIEIDAESGTQIYLLGRDHRPADNIYGEQWSHAHPDLTADNQWVIFSSARDGHAQV